MIFLLLLLQLVGPILGPILGGALSQAFSWRSTFIMVVMYVGVIILPMVASMPETHQYKKVRCKPAAVASAGYDSHVCEGTTILPLVVILPEIHQYKKVRCTLQHVLLFDSVSK
jgi:MFS family permease